MKENAIGKKIRVLRNKHKMTQEQLADKLGVTSQAISSWERSETLPDIPRIVEIAHLFDVSTDYVLDNIEDNDLSFNDEKKMFTYVRAYANSKKMLETSKALQFAREKHRHQKRKEGKAYIIHPLAMACNALAMGLDDDNLIATILLHDVCEDCNISPDALPVNERIKENVCTLTFKLESGASKQDAKKRYYDRIGKNREATIVKLLDRCDNVSNMAKAFSIDEMCSYIEETRQYVLPLHRKAKIAYPDLYNVLFILKYHISSIIDSIEQTINLYEKM